MSANPEFVYNPPITPYLTLLYQDDAMVVIDKPSGLLSVPGKAPEHHDSVAGRVATVFPESRIVHRLDMATSGVMVLALGKENHKALSRQFELRQTAKRYYARVAGQPSQTKGSIDLPLICDWPNRPKQKVDHENGKPSLTHYQVIQSTSSESLIELLPVTGRSHQLRVHMLALGHPILGDRLYGNSVTISAATRLQLHAETLILNHPQTGQRMRFSAPLPFAEYTPPLMTKN